MLDDVASQYAKELFRMLKGGKDAGKLNAVYMPRGMRAKFQTVDLPSPVQRKQKVRPQITRHK